MKFFKGKSFLAGFISSLLVYLMILGITYYQTGFALLADFRLDLVGNLFFYPIIPFFPFFLVLPLIGIAILNWKKGDKKVSFSEAVSSILYSFFSYAVLFIFTVAVGIISAITF